MDQHRRTLTEQLPFDYSLKPIGHPDFFYPLSLTLDPEEKQKFLVDKYPLLKANVLLRNLELTNFGHVRDMFPKTVIETNKFLKDLKVKVSGFNLFCGIGNSTTWSIHKDGTMFEDQCVGLEARLSYYELAEAPGIIRWWNDEDMPTEFVDNSYSPSANPQHKFNLMATVAPGLKSGQLSWKDIPAPAFSTSTDLPSGLLKVNAPHHVIQGPGFRVTLGAQITFDDGNPIGVWEHLKKNLHLILS